jgi:PEGA domain
MRVQSLVVAAAVIISSVALVRPTEGAQRQRWPGAESRGGNGGGNEGGGNGSGNRGGGGERQAGERRAEARSGGGRRESGGNRPESRPSPPAYVAQERQQPELRQQPESRRAPAAAAPGMPADVRRGTSERWTNEGRVGAQPRVAVPRQGPAPRPGYDGNRNGYRVYAPYGGQGYYKSYPYRHYRYVQPYYYYPYAFGYGPYGRGHFYFDLHYDSYVFYPGTVVRYDNYGAYYGNYGYPVGELRLQVRPRDAQVFIDGSYAGTVDDFDGTFQSLRLEGGDYKVEIVLPGYEPLDFDVRITPGEKVTYKGDLIPEQP